MSTGVQKGPLGWSAQRDVGGGEDLGEESGVCPESGDNDIVDSARN